MERLSALDAEFLLVEDGIAHMHIAGISVFEGLPPTLDELTEMVAAKLHLIPRYRQRVRSVPWELGRPVWVDDPRFDLSYHIRSTALPAPGDDTALRRLMSRLMSQELDRQRPLWELWLVDGLEDGRWALISKIHHCMVDGVSGVDLLSILLDVEPDVPLPEPRAWVPEPEPSGIAKVLDAWSGLVTDGLGMVARAPSALRHGPGGVATSLLDTGRGVAEFVKHLGLTTPTTLEGSRRSVGRSTQRSTTSSSPCSPERSATSCCTVARIPMRRSCARSCRCRCVRSTPGACPTTGCRRSSSSSRCTWPTPPSGSGSCTSRWWRARHRT
jgi:WS/DGAT/MGAT family acyltransferase